MSVAQTTRVALITGGGRPRVGSVVARGLADDGYAVAIHYHRSGESAQRVVEELRTARVDAEAFQADVTSEAHVEEMCDAVVQRFGRIDVLVTMAAIWDAKPLDQLTADDLRRHFDVNTLGTFLCARRVGLQMVAQNEGGAIVTVGDWAIARPYLDHAAYFVSKGAVPTMTRVLAVELAVRNPRVRVNCIHPGPVMFPPDASQQEQQEMIDSTLVKLANQPDAITEAVRFLINSPFVTGTCIPVDGGRTVFSPDSTTRRRPI